MPFLAASEASPEKEGISGWSLLPPQPALNRTVLGVVQPSVGTLASQPPASRSRTAWPPRILPPAQAFPNIKITAITTVAVRDGTVRNGLVQWSTCQKPRGKSNFSGKTKIKTNGFFCTYSRRGWAKTLGPEIVPNESLGNLK